MTNHIYQQPVLGIWIFEEYVLTDKTPVENHINNIKKI